MAATGTPATRVLAAARVPHILHPYQHDAGNQHFGDEAVAALGLDPARVFKTLVCLVHGNRDELAVAVVPVAGQLDLKAFAAALDAKKAELADQASAERATGYLVGGISPLGQKKALRTVVDASAQDLEVIFVSAGRRGLQVELSPADLVRLTRARVAAVAR